MKIRTTRDAGAHDSGHLRHMQSPAHQRVVIEDARGAVFAREDAVLVGKVDARGIHQVHDGNAIPHRDFLRAQDLRNRLRPPGAGLNCGIVGYHHGGAIFDFAKAGDHSGRWGLAVILIVGNEQSDFEEHGARVEQLGDTLVSRKLSVAMLLLDFLRSSATPEAFLEVVEILHELFHAAGRSGGVHDL
jgi:hypothetical protein